MNVNRQRAVFAQTPTFDVESDAPDPSVSPGRPGPRGQRRKAPKRACGGASAKMH
jgi:hypothetical protein